jgi:hypothetical protein
MSEYALHEGDTGSTEVQVRADAAYHPTCGTAVQTRPSFATRPPLMLVGQRRRLLNYLAKEDAALSTAHSPPWAAPVLSAVETGGRMTMQSERIYEV